MSSRSTPRSYTWSPSRGAYLRLLALFIQTVVSNKFIGHGIVIGVFVMVPSFSASGGRIRCIFFGNTPPYTYSDMNGYGTSCLPSSGPSPTGFHRLPAGHDFHRARTPGPTTPGRRASAGRAARPPGSSRGSDLLPRRRWQRRMVFYNSTSSTSTHCAGRRDISATYEATSRSTSTWRNPRSSPSTPISIYSRAPLLLRFRQFRAAEQDRTTDQPDQSQLATVCSNVRFDRPFHAVSTSARALYTIYHLDTPLAPATSSISPSTSATRAAASRTVTSVRNWPTRAPFSTSITFPPSATT